MTQIKVGGVTYTISTSAHLTVDADAYGLCDYAGARIVLDESLAPERMQQVLFHELIHAMLYEAGFDDHDEDMVQRLSIVLYQVISDNFTFGSIDEIREMLKGEKEHRPDRHPDGSAKMGFARETGTPPVWVPIEDEDGDDRPTEGGEINARIKI